MRLEGRIYGVLVGLYDGVLSETRVLPSALKRPPRVSTRNEGVEPSQSVAGCFASNRTSLRWEPRSSQLFRQARIDVQSVKSAMDHFEVIFLMWCTWLQCQHSSLPMLSWAPHHHPRCGAFLRERRVYRVPIVGRSHHTMAVRSKALLSWL